MRLLDSALDLLGEALVLGVVPEDYEDAVIEAVESGDPAYAWNAMVFLHLASLEAADFAVDEGDEACADFVAKVTLFKREVNVLFNFTAPDTLAGL